MKFSIFTFLILIATFSFSQNSGNYWYFGNNAGIDFNTGAPVALSDGQLNTLEGCATISDPVTGDLLFYTSGLEVFDADHNIMPNGSDLHGNSSSTSSALVVKKPGSDNIYIIFTLDVVSSFNNYGLQYSEVDMSLNGGLGDVNSVKNVSIFDDTNEKIAVVQHNNGVDFWIIIEDYIANGFRSYLFTSTGISGTPVHSITGLLPVSPFLLGSQGYLKANSSGDRIAAAFTLSGVQVFDFDNSTGLLTNPIPLSIPLNAAYGVEFSPNNQFLYVSLWYSGGTNLFQYDLQAGTEMDIIGSQVDLITGSFYSKGAVQIGPDGVIYVANDGEEFIGAIANPDVAGTGCLYTENSVLLYPGTNCLLGFPVFQNNVVQPPNIEVANICLGDSIALENTELSNPNWSLQSTPNVIISTDSIFTVSPIVNTIYMAIEGTDTLIRTIHVHNPPVVNLGADLCEATGNVILDASSFGNEFLWSDGSDTTFIEITETGTYWVDVSIGTCTSRDSIFVQFEDISIQSETIVECDSTLNLTAVDSNSISGSWTYLGPPGSIGLVVFSPDTVSKNIQVTVPILGEYVFTYVSNCGNEAQQTVNFISVEPDLNIFTEQACNFEINLIAENPAQNGKWSVVSPEDESATIDNEIAATTTATVTNYGEYTFTYTYDFCQASFSQTIDILSVAPIINKDTTLYICELNFDLEAEIIDQIKGWKVLEGPGIVTFSSFDNGSTSVEVTEYGNYSIEFEGCGGRDTIDVRFEKEKPSISSPEFVECGLQALLEVNFVGEMGNWSVEPANDENIELDVQNDHQVIITSDKYGATRVTYTACDTTVSRDVVFLCSLEIPNVFTPNNDAYNTEFFIPRLDPTFYSKSQFKVFNRWGVEVYHNGQYGLQGSWWNGKTNNGAGEELSEGVYFYELNLYNKVKKEEENYKGTIHLFR